jgi:hypothetical protein
VRFRIIEFRGNSLSIPLVRFRGKQEKKRPAVDGAEHAELMQRLKPGHTPDQSKYRVKTTTYITMPPLFNFDGGLEKRPNAL